ACYRKAAEVFENLLEYPVEVEGAVFENQWSDIRNLRQFPATFSYGCGSQTDNWLLRRFLALGATEDAAREFSRMWRLHQSLVGNGAFPGRSAEFALDYLRFLTQTKRMTEANDLVRTILPRLNLPLIENPHSQPDNQLRRLHSFASDLPFTDLIREVLAFYRSQRTEPELTTLLKKTNPKTGKPAASLVYARVLLVQGDREGSLREELAYLDETVTATPWRSFLRGQRLAQFGQPQTALREFETCLTLLEKPPEILELINSPNFLSELSLRWNTSNEAERVQLLRIQTLRKLSQLQCQIGAPDDCMKAKFAYYEAAPGNVPSFTSLKKDLQNHPELSEWANRFLARNPHHRYSAEYGTMVGNQEATFTALLWQAQVGLKLSQLKEQKTAFARQGLDWYRPLLERLIAQFPNNGWFRLELANLEDPPQPEALIAAYEAFLRDPKTFRSDHSDGPAQHRLESVFEVASRLTGLYVITHNQEKLVTLALQLAKAEAPFQAADSGVSLSPESWASGYAALSLALQNVTEPVQRQLLEAALKTSLWAESLPPGLSPNKAGTAQNSGSLVEMTPVYAAQSDIRAVVSYQNVLCLSHDEKHLYVGHPWGVAVRDWEGNLKKTVVLGQAVTALAAEPEAIWVGSAAGVFRVDKKNFSPSLLTCDQELTEQDKKWPNFDIERDFQRFNLKKVYLSENEFNSVKSLAIQDDWLWIGTARTLRRFNVKTHEMRIYLPDELGLGHSASWNRIWIDGQYVWATGDYASCRYNWQTDRWIPVTGLGGEEVRLMGIIDGQMWGQFYFDKKAGFRLCLIDRETRSMLPIFLRDDDDVQPFDWQDDKKCYGFIQGQPVFGRGAPQWLFEPETMIVRKLTQSDLEKWLVTDSSIVPGLIEEPQHQRTDGSLFFIPLPGTFPGKLQESNIWQKLPNGTTALGTSKGVWLLPAGTGQRARPVAKLSFGSRIHFVVQGETVYTWWIGTDEGLLAINQQQGVIDQIRKEQMPPVLFDSSTKPLAVWQGDQLALISQKNHLIWLTVFDPVTRFFSVSKLYAPQDSYRLESLTLGTTPGFLLVQLIKGPERNLDPAALTLEISLATRRIFQIIPNQPLLFPKNRRPDFSQTVLPYLGGRQQGEVVFPGGVCRWGERGVLLASTPISPAPEVERLAVKLVPSQPLFQRQDAQTVQLPKVVTEEDVNQAIATGNPFLLLRILERSEGLMKKEGSPLLSTVLPLLHHSNPRIRTLVLQYLRHVRHDAVEAALRTAVRGPFPETANQAAIELAYRGLVEDKPLLVNLLNRFYLEREDQKAIFNALAVFSITDQRRTVNQSPPNTTQTNGASEPPGFKQEIMDLLLRKHQQVAESGADKPFQVLADHAQAHPGFLTKILSTVKPSQGPRSFLFRFAKQAGPNILPHLHEALLSSHPTVRANAASACAALQDPSSIPFLILGLDLASEVSQPAILDALVELKATVSIPALARLYAELKQEEYLRQNPNYPRRYWWQEITADTGTAQASQAVDLPRLDRMVWPRFQNLPDPARRVTSAGLLATVKKMGPASTQFFFRELAQSDYPEARQVAARHLGDTLSKSSADILLLQELLEDRFLEVRITAAGSLLLQGETAGHQVFLQWLSNPRNQGLYLALKQLERVTDPAALEFARPALTNLQEKSDLGLSDREQVNTLILKLKNAVQSP
ncbi:MAG: hypothetical protein K1Y36_27735, partial [Blastocatellia bacterium]|nr:hypothetical protein [Blastocatellia bacterium]